MQNNEWYVYKHIRLDKNEPFYIGIGKTKNYKRAYEHYKCDRNNIWFRITNKTDYIVEIIIDNLSKEQAVNKEIELIKLYGRKDLNTGILCNLTNGGDGIWGAVRSEETKSKLRAQKIGSKNPMWNKPSPKRRTIEVYNLDNIFIKEFESITLACMSLGISHLRTKASAVAKGKRNSTGGYIFKYK